MSERNISAVRLGRRSIAVLTVASIAGLLMFAWPLILDPDQDATDRKSVV